MKTATATSDVTYTTAMNIVGVPPGMDEPRYAQEITATKSSFVSGMLVRLGAPSPPALGLTLSVDIQSADGSVPTKEVVGASPNGKASSNVAYIEISPFDIATSGDWLEVEFEDFVEVKENDLLIGTLGANYTSAAPVPLVLYTKASGSGFYSYAASKWTSVTNTSAGMQLVLCE